MLQVMWINDRRSVEVFVPEADGAAGPGAHQQGHGHERLPEHDGAEHGGVRLVRHAHVVPVEDAAVSRIRPRRQEQLDVRPIIAGVGIPETVQFIYNQVQLSSHVSCR